MCHFAFVIPFDVGNVHRCEQTGSENDKSKESPP